MARLVLYGRIIIADPRFALLGQSSASRERKLVAAAVVEGLKFADPPLLLRAVAHKVLELSDLESGELPVARVDVPAGADFLIQHEARQSGFGLGHVGADVADD